MKHAILGPRKAVMRILDEENDRTVAISNAKAQLVNEIKEQDEIPFYIDNQITSRKIEIEKGNMMRWDEETETWNISKRPIPVPRLITSWQAIAALKLTPFNDGNLFDAVNQSINSLPEGPQKIVIQTAWDNNANFERNSPTILSIAQNLELSSDQIDSLFILGHSLKV